MHANFDLLKFVLVETSHPGNAGAAARAMKTMGFTNLCLVNPARGDIREHPEAVAFASGATDVLSQATVTDSLGNMLAPCVFTAALTSRPREYSPPVMTPREFAKKLPSLGGPVALLFGSERTGLPNETVLGCSAVIEIPTGDLHSSLNLSQAVQIMAYECSLALSEQYPEPVKNDPHAPGFTDTPATKEEIEGMFAHLKDTLEGIGFYKPDNPGRLMDRLRRLFARTSLEREEINIIRGLCKQIEKKLLKR